MATERTAMLPDGTVIFLDTNKDAMTPFGVVVSEQNIAVAGGRINSLTNYGGLAGHGGIAGIGGGLAG